MKLITSLSPVVALLALGACVATTTAPVSSPPPSATARAAHRQVIEIVNDKGGNVTAAVLRRNQLAASGAEVRISGYCRSACMINLSLPNACLDPKARVGFHAPRLPGTTIIPPGVPEIMGNFYRGKVRERWDSQWRYQLEMTKMSAQEYKALDPQMRLCE